MVWIEGLGTTTASPYADADFGFGPSLSVNKSVTSGVLEGEEVEYNITVRNLRPGGGVSQGNYCVYTAWGSQKDIEHSEKIDNKKWLYESNVYGEPDNVFAITELANANDTLAVTGFDLSAQPGQIIAVTLVVYADEAFLPITGHTLETSIWFTDADESAQTPFAYTEFDGTIGVTDVLTRDLTASHPGGVGGWDWDDFVSNVLDLVFVGNKGTGAGDIGMDAVALQVTADEPCQVDDSDIIATAPLTDAITYNPDILQFVSAVPTESDVDHTAGVITWTNIGPLDPGESATIRATFLAIGPDGASSVTSTNEACVTGAVFSDGDPANDDCDTATTIITPTGAITGFVWSDPDSSGWPYEDASDFGIPGVSVYLYACLDGNGDSISLEITNGDKNKTCSQLGGTWTNVKTRVTDIDGAYVFDGLLDAYYYVEVDDTTLPDGSGTQTAEPDNAANGAGIDCGACDDQWGGDEDLHDGSVYLINPINSAETITDVNFGYNVRSHIDGTIWYDWNRSGTSTPDIGEEWLTGVVVTLTHPDGSYETTTTDANGYFSFVGPYTGTYTITVDTDTGDMSSGTWIQTYDTDGLATLDQVIVTLATGGYGRGDYSYYQAGTYTVGDTVYVDWNGDGDQDAGEEGLSGITLYLYEDSNGDGLIDTGTDALVMNTDASGVYSFTDLVTGTYIVVVDESDLPAWEDYVQTQDPDEDPGLCSICTGSGSVTLSSTNPSDLYIDFGYQPLGYSSIGDYVWYDADGDTVQDQDEIGLADILVRLYRSDGDDIFEPAGDDALVNSISSSINTSTTITGFYMFSGLASGVYWVDVDTGDLDLPTDIDGNPYILSTGNDPISVTLPTSVYTDVYDFGFTTAGVIGDYVWQDNNNDGIQDAGEPGLVVSVTLYSWTDVDGDGIYSTITDTISQTASTSTDSSGLYRFAGLSAGDYVVLVSNLPDHIDAQTYDPDRMTVCSDSSRPSDPPCDAATGVTLAAGGTFLSADFGFRPERSIGDYVWLDSNDDGVQDPGEVGIGAVVITLTQPGGGVVTTSTDLDGYYSFGGIDLTANGIYAIQVATSSLPSSLIQTYDLNGALDDTATLDIQTASFITDVVDFGYRYNGNLNLGGHVFFDAGGTGDGTTDNYESVPDDPYENITLYLWNESGILIGTTETDANGQYTFTNLIGGGAHYTVTLNANSPQLAGMDLSAVGDYELANIHSVLNMTTSVTDVDYGFYAALDFGDLPINFNATLISDEGPYHITSTLFLGAAVDAEGDGDQSQVDATADNYDDGVRRDTSTLWLGGNTVTLIVTTTGGSGRLAGWFDWDADGTLDEFVDFGEVDGSSQNVSLTLPVTFDPATNPYVYARFRLFDPANLPGGVLDAGDYIGSADGGEVEDYRWQFSPTAVGLLSLGEGDGSNSDALVWLGALAVLVLAGLSLLVARRGRAVRVPVRRSE